MTTEIDFGPQANLVHHNILVETNRGTVPDEDGDVTVFVDRAKMSQVIHNLVSNGSKFTPPGGRVSVVASLEEVSVPSSRERNNGYVRFPWNEFAVGPLVDQIFVRITVTDTGVGLSQVNNGFGVATSPSVLRRWRFLESFYGKYFLILCISFIRSKCN